MKEHTGHNRGYIDSCDYGFLSRQRTKKSHPRDECFSHPTYVFRHDDSEAFACLDHMRTIAFMLLEPLGAGEVTIRFYNKR